MTPPSIVTRTNVANASTSVPRGIERFISTRHSRTASIHPWKLRAIRRCAGAFSGSISRARRPSGQPYWPAGGDDAFAVTGQNGEDAFHRFGPGGEGGIDDHRPKKLEILFEDGAEQSFLAVEEVIKAAGVDTRVSQQLGHARSGKTALPEKKAGGVDQTIAGWSGILRGRHRFFLTERILLASILLERSTNRHDKLQNARRRYIAQSCSRPARGGAKRFIHCIQ